MKATATLQKPAHQNTISTKEAATVSNPLQLKQEMKLAFPAIKQNPLQFIADKFPRPGNNPLQLKQKKENIESISGFDIDAGLKDDAINPESSAAKPGAVVQRAIAIGSNPLPRTVDTPADIADFLQTNGLYNVFRSLNDERETIYIFESRGHLLNFLRKLTGQPVSETVNDPLKSKVSPEQLNQGHKFAADVRFASLYKPGASQISENAPGAHEIPAEMLPPPGQAHQWGQVPDPSAFGQEYVLYQHKYQPSSNTIPFTFGDPDAPSMVMSQGGLNLGMHIQPTSNSSYLNQISRSDTNYAGLPSVTGRVRGHPFELKQNQISTDDDAMDFDQSPPTYTDESDATKEKGGISSWRYNEVEKKAEQSGLPFTQVNNNPVLGPMGIVQPDSMYYRIQQSSGGYKDLLMDNTGTTDYRDTDAIRPHGMGKQAYQTEMGYQEALLHPYQPPSVRKPGEDFTDVNRHSYPGYMSPPPTPFLSDDTIVPEAETMILAGYPHVNAKVKLPNGKTGIVTKVISRDKKRIKSQCLVKTVPAMQWPDSFV